MGTNPPFTYAFTLEDYHPNGDRLEEQDRLMTIAQVAEYCAVSRRTVNRWLAGERWMDGRPLPYYRLGEGDKAPVRVRRSDLLQWLEQFR